MSKCPFSKEIIDEASGVVVPNPEWIAYQIGYNDGFKDGQLAGVGSEMRGTNEEP